MPPEKGSNLMRFYECVTLFLSKEIRENLICFTIQSVPISTLIHILDPIQEIGISFHDACFFLRIIKWGWNDNGLRVLTLFLETNGLIQIQVFNRNSL